MQARHASLLICALTLCLPSVSHAQYAYTITALDDDTTDFHPEGINNSGQISGYAYAPVTYGGSTNFYTHAFYYKDGQLHDVSPLYPYNDSGGKINDQGNMIAGGGLYNVNTHQSNNLSGLPSSILTGINQNGDIAGTTVDNTHDTALIYHSDTGQTQYFSAPHGSLNDTAIALNNNGVAAGYSIYPDGGLRVTLFSNGVGQDLGQQTNGVNTQAMDINDAGDITGYSSILNGNGVVQSFLYHNGRYINIGTLPGEGSIFAYGLSNDGDVIGGTYYHPFIYHNGKLSNLFDLVDPSLGWTNGYAMAVHDQGWIVGYGNQGGFLLKPRAAPAPGSLVVMGVGIGLLALRLRRRTSP